MMLIHFSSYANIYIYIYIYIYTNYIYIYIYIYVEQRRRLTNLVYFNGIFPLNIALCSLKDKRVMCAESAFTIGNCLHQPSDVSSVVLRL